MHQSAATSSKARAVDHPPGEKGLTFNQTVREIVEFLEVAIHTILFIRGVYPPDLFVRRRKWDAPVYQSRHPALNEYIAGAVGAVRDELLLGKVDKMVLVIKNGQDVALERRAIDKLWSLPGLKLPPHVTHKLDLTGPNDPLVPSSFRVGTVAQTSIACSALSSAYVHQLRHGRDEPQTVSVNSRHAVLDFKSESWVTLDGKLTPDIWDPLAGVYKTKDGYVRIHTNFPHHRDIILTTLNLPTHPVPSRDQVTKAFESWSSQEFEDVATRAGGCVSKIRSFEEWDAHPHAIHSAGKLPLTLDKTGEAPIRDIPTKPGDMPLAGVRVLDLTRVIAGPVCGRTLAAHGADVIWITSPNLPDLPALDIDTSRGKRTIQLDLNDESDLVTFRNLLEDADVLLQSYRPGALSRRGFGPEALAKDYPGIITANLSAYGTDGPWGGRRGFDSLVQAATGFNIAEASAFNSPQESHSPVRALPVQALDHAAGHLLALGINAALARRIKASRYSHLHQA
ncbi:unnamed protein product [Rhizoctonia solani]|uniref:HORMA domain-containing protein n=1 Tax=Rhizoctonia solani TaxID=456999 RepID=A0A8H3E904_9AGAM|nr:unnamed protein product [Rhizoctonia solani]